MATNEFIGHCSHKTTCFNHFFPLMPNGIATVKKGALAERGLQLIKPKDNLLFLLI